MTDLKEVTYISWITRTKTVEKKSLRISECLNKYKYLNFFLNESSLSILNYK